MELESSKDNFRMIKKNENTSLSVCNICDWSLILCRIIFCITYLVLLGLQEIDIGCFSIFRKKLSEHVNFQVLDDAFMSPYYPVSFVS